MPGWFGKQTYLMINLEGQTAGTIQASRWEVLTVLDRHYTAQGFTLVRSQPRKEISIVRHAR